MLETARGRFPKDRQALDVQAELLIRQKKFADEARALLDGPGSSSATGSSSGWPARTLAVAGAGRRSSRPSTSWPGASRPSRGGPPAAADRAGRRAGPPAGPARAPPAAWSRLVEEEPESFEPRLQLFDLALQSGDGKQAEEQIRAVAKLDEQFGQFCRAQFLAWQAQGRRRAGAKEKLRGEARGLLTELKAAPPGLVPGPAGPGRG